MTSNDIESCKEWRTLALHVANEIFASASSKKKDDKISNYRWMEKPRDLKSKYCETQKSEKVNVTKV